MSEDEVEESSISEDDGSQSSSDGGGEGDSQDETIKFIANGMAASYTLLVSSVPFLKPGWFCRFAPGSIDLSRPGVGTQAPLPRLTHPELLLLASPLEEFQELSRQSSGWTRSIIPETRHSSTRKANVWFYRLWNSTFDFFLLANYENAKKRKKGSITSKPQKEEPNQKKRKIQMFESKDNSNPLDAKSQVRSLFPLFLLFPLCKRVRHVGEQLARRVRSSKSWRWGRFSISFATWSFLFLPCHSPPCALSNKPLKGSFLQTNLEFLGLTFGFF